MSRRPNVLWLMTDEQRCDSMGCYGSPWARTPRLDALAAGGVVFENAYTPSPVCVSARVAMLTGKAPSTTGVMHNSHALRDEHARFLTHRFSRAGYATASFGKQHYNNPAQAFDTQVMRVLGDRVGYFRYLVEADQSPENVVSYAGDELSQWILAGRYPGRLDETPEAASLRDGLAWLEQRDRTRPYLLRVSLNAPHTPVVAPEEFDHLIDPRDIALPIDRNTTAWRFPDALRRALLERSGVHRLSDAQVARMRQCYYGLVAAVDALLGSFLDMAERGGHLNETVIVFCSDHGAHLGDHGFVQKQSMLDASARVPLFFAGEGVAEGRRVATPCSVGSLLPTLMEMAVVEIPSDVAYPSLAETVSRGAEPTDRAVISEIDYGDRGGRPGDRYVMVRRGRWKLTCFAHADGRPTADAGEMLFDLESDPGERRNLAGRPEHAAVQSSLAEEIAKWDRRNGSLCGG